MDVANDPQYRTSDGSALRIWQDAAQNKFLSEREGRAIFDEVTYVEVISPGSGNSAPVFEVKRVFALELNHPAPKFGVKYAEYKQYLDDFEKGQGEDASLAGTPLSQWVEMSRTMVASLKAQGVFTVDALAHLPDGKLYVVGPDGRTWREKALAYIENAKNSGAATAFAAENERLRTDLADQGEQLKAMSAKLDAALAQLAGVGQGGAPTLVDPLAGATPAASGAPASII